MLLNDLSFLDELAASDQISGAILVANGDKVLFSKAYGLADSVRGIPNQLDTAFNLGSMNKMFTGVAVTQLAEAGRLSFDDPVDNYLPGLLGAGGREITLHHLLTHTSGLGNFMDNPRYMSLKDELKNVQDLLPLVASEPVQFEPGSRFLYSNSGYIVLGAVIERVANESYFDYLQAQIFGVAGMDRSGFYERDSELHKIARGYTAVRTDGSTSTDASRPGERPPADDGVPYPVPREESGRYLSAKGSPAGGGYSTVEDMLKFSRALLEHKLMSPAYTDTAITGKVAMGMRMTMTGPGGPGGTLSATPPIRTYGYGFSDGEVEGVRIVGHNGGGPGVNAQLDIYPSSGQGHTVVILANYDGVLPLILNKIRRAVIANRANPL